MRIRVLTAVGAVLLICSLGLSATMLRHTAVANCSPSVVLPAVLYVVESQGGVTSGATTPSQFKVTSGSATVLELKTYHYVTPSGLASTGQIGLKSSDGTTYGPWQTTGSPGIHGIANAFWTATVNVVLPPATYTVTDSDPATWSANAETRGAGMFWVTGFQNP